MTDGEEDPLTLASDEPPGEEEEEI